MRVRRYSKRVGRAWYGWRCRMPWSTRERSRNVSVARLAPVATTSSSKRRAPRKISRSTSADQRSPSASNAIATWLLRSIVPARSGPTRAAMPAARSPPASGKAGGEVGNATLVAGAERGFCCFKRTPATASGALLFPTIVRAHRRHHRRVKTVRCAPTSLDTNIRVASARRHARAVLVDDEPGTVSSLCRSSTTSLVPDALHRPAHVVALPVVLHVALLVFAVPWSTWPAAICAGPWVRTSTRSRRRTCAADPRPRPGRRGTAGRAANTARP